MDKSKIMNNGGVFLKGMQRQNGDKLSVQADTTSTIDRAAYKQQKRVSHSSRPWKSEIQMPSWFGSGDDLLMCTLLSSRCVLTW